MLNTPIVFIQTEVTVSSWTEFNIGVKLLSGLRKNWKSVRITHAGSWMVCKQYIVLNHVLSEKKCISEANC